MLSSSSEFEDIPAEPDEGHGEVKEESEEERSIEPVWRQMKAVKQEVEGRDQRSLGARQSDRGS